MGNREILDTLRLILRSCQSDYEKTANNANNANYALLHSFYIGVAIGFGKSVQYIDEMMKNLGHEMTQEEREQFFEGR